MLKIIPKLEQGMVPDRSAQGWNVDGQKRRAARKECKRLRGKKDGTLHGTEKGLWNIAKKGHGGRLRSDAQRRKAIQSENTKPYTRITFSVAG